MTLNAKIGVLWEKFAIFSQCWNSCIGRGLQYWNSCTRYGAKRHPPSSL